MNYAKITTHDINNGPGFRLSLWISGCPFKCKNCHNPELWNKDIGNIFNEETVKEILNLFQQHPELDGLSVLGGEPLWNKDGFSLLEHLFYYFKNRFPSKTIWIYTGYIWEQLDLEQKGLISYADVLVDGLYIEELRDITLPFRGSSNQRLINIRKSINEQKIILYETN